MLAQLLRRVLLAQALMGAGLAWLLYNHGTQGYLGMLAFAIVLPCVSAVLVSVATAIRSRAHEGVAVWWRALVGETAAEFAVFVLRQPWASAPPAVLPALLPPATGTCAIPVVLVHGYLCNHRIWDEMAQDLRARGHTVLAVNLEPLFCSIDQYAPIVNAAVQELRRHTGGKSVALVGHSMGGLAIRAWMRAHGTRDVAGVITLGTPHAGTRIDPHSRTTNGRQMNWRSPWLAELAAAETSTTRALLRIAITPQDNIVYPQRAQTLAGIEPTIFEGIGHVQMCRDANVIQWVGDQLGAL